MLYIDIDALFGASESLSDELVPLLGEIGLGGSIVGGPGDDTLRGTDDDDTLVGFGGDDSLSGRDDDDLLVGGTGADTLRGGDGDDTLIGGSGPDSLAGGEGYDYLFGGGGSDTLAGGRDDDLLEGNAGTDSLRGGSGEDTLKGGVGNDTLRGGSDEDLLEGGAGADSLNGGSDDDTLKGGGGDDTLRGGGGDDFLDGGAGDNTYIGNGGSDTFVIGTEDSFNTIESFRIGQDDGIALDGGFQIDDLIFMSSPGGTTIVADGIDLAFVGGVSPGALLGEAEDIFTTVSAEAISLSFEDIELPETIEFGDTGSVTLELTNTFDLDFEGHLDLNLFISTDDDRDSESDIRNDGLLASLKLDLELDAGESTEVEIDYETLTSVIAPGAYHLLAEVEGGELTSALVSAEGTNSVLAWHASALNAIQEFGEDDSDATGIGIEPTVGSRALAIIQTSVFNAVNAFDEDFEFYLDLDPGSPAAGASADAAVAGAAVTALANVLPGTADLTDTIVAQLESSLDLSSSEVTSLLTAAGLGAVLEAPIDDPATPPAFVTPFLSEAPTPGTQPAGISDAIWDGFLLGLNAADQVLDARSGDGFIGFFQGPDDPATYDPSIFSPSEYVWLGEQVFADGVLQFGGAPFALSPGWADVLTFSGVSASDFLANADIDADGDGLFLDGRPFDIETTVDGVTTTNTVTEFNQQLFLDEIIEVQELGALEDTDVTTVTRSLDETEIAIFWAYDRADTFRPYGQLHQIAQEAAFREAGGEPSLAESARILGLTSIALADAAIVAWTEKYVEVQPRPQDVISGDFGQFTPIGELDLAALGADLLVGEVPVDFDWQPLLPDPAFPDFLSGHSTFAGAFGGVLDTLFPDVEFIPVVSQELVPGNGIFTTSNDELFDIDDFGAVREFSSYGAIGAEDAISRLFGGVHVFEATEDAVIVGTDVGEFVASSLLAPVA
ncbi:hypothetical protein [Synechococcus sp. PCC 7336]|uniref:hypothetical protein n=1 Tax=Synechococcus sp. PCC 7336 TaxID=195250 RepID=UPI0003490F7B|nr:hypothetical protein [Synechococcus sp. PCC 7336]